MSIEKGKFESIPEADAEREGEKREHGLIQIFDMVESEEISPEQEKEIIERIKDSPSRDFMEFALINLRENPKRHLLSQNVVDTILEREFSLYDSSNETRGEYLMLQFQKAFQLYGDFKRENADEESLTDKAFSAFTRLYEKYPEPAWEFWVGMGQEHTVRPDILVKGMADMMSNPEIPQDFKTRLAGDFNYQYTFSSNAYDQAIKENINFTDPEKYARTGQFLEFLRRLHGISQIHGYSEKKGLELPGLMEEAIESKKGSYLLNLRAREIHKNMVEQDSLDPGEGSILLYRGQRISKRGAVPFQLTPDQYAFELDGNLYTSESRRKEDVESLRGELSKQLERNHQYETELDTKIKRTVAVEISTYEKGLKKEDRIREDSESDYSRFFDDRSEKIIEQRKENEKLREIYEQKVQETARDELQTLSQGRKEANRIYNDLIGEMSHRLEIDDLTVKRLDKTKEEREEDIHDLLDYSYLMREEGVRNIVEREFNIELSDLSLKEQFYFLQFIKNKEASEIEPVKEFVKQYGVDGLRTFVSLDYGKEVGSKILEIGKELEKEDVKEIFAEYSQITNLAEKFYELLSNSKAIQEADFPEDLKMEFPGNIYEAILRRSKDLLVSAHMLEVENIDTELNVEDLKHAFYGLRTFLEIMRDLETQEKHELEVVDQTDQLYKFKARNREDGTEYGFKIFIRPEEEKDAQARINFELDFDTKHPNEELKQAFYQETDFKAKKKTLQQSVLRIGIDRDTYGGGEDVSLDVGRSAYDSDRFSRTGDVLGNLLSLTAEGGHHTTASFDKKYATPQAFKVIANLFQKFLDEKYMRISEKISTKNPKRREK